MELDYDKELEQDKENGDEDKENVNLDHENECEIENRFCVILVSLHIRHTTVTTFSFNASCIAR